MPPLLRRRCFWIWILAILTLFLLSSKKYDLSFDGTVMHVRPFMVWEYVMDFNNMKHLNPTIIDFRILSDEGNEMEWRYKVEYTEFLHQLPFIKHRAVAEYKFLTISDNIYVIKSKHTTCFFNNFFCVYTTSKFSFQQDRRNADDTYCREDVHYECPRIIGFFCHNEVMYQRKSVFQNLQKAYKKY